MTDKPDKAEKPETITVDHEVGGSRRTEQFTKALDALNTADKLASLPGKPHVIVKWGSETITEYNGGDDNAVAADHD